MVMRTLILTGLIALPQIWVTLRYLPKSIRQGRTYKDKVENGSVRPIRLLWALIRPRLRDKPTGVYYPEMTCFIGYMALLLALFDHTLSHTLLAGILATLAMGKHVPLFKLVHLICLRIPARFLYFLGVTLVLMAVKGLSTLSTELTKGFLSHTLSSQNTTTTILTIIVILQAWDLCSNSARLAPMEPFTQRWMKPSQGYGGPLTSFLTTQLAKGTHKVSGLPYPNSTGQIQHIRSLGYSGGFMTKQMAYFRKIHNPDGQGDSDWFATREDSYELNWYGVKYAYTYRPLKTPKWVPTAIPHLYENREVYINSNEL